MREQYAEWPVRAAAADLLVCAWSRSTADGPPRTYRIVPDGCVDLIWTGSTLFVAGPDTQAQLATAGAGIMHGGRFRPGVAPALFGMPAAELTDSRPALSELDRVRFADRLPDDLAAAALELLGDGVGALVHLGLFEAGAQNVRDFVVGDWHVALSGRRTEPAARRWRPGSG